MYIGISAPGIGRHPPRVAMALRTTRLGFHIVRDGIDPGDYRFLLWFIGVVYICIYVEGFPIRELDPILPGWRWLYEPRVIVSTPCGAVSTRGVTVVVPGLLEL